MLICGALGRFISSLYALPFRAGSSPPSGITIPVIHPMLNHFSTVFVIAGTTLCIWGLARKDKNSTKKVVFGTGLFICGILGNFFHNLYSLFIYIGLGPMDGNLFGSLVSLHHPMLSYFAVSFVIVGTVLCIWGLTDRDKNKLKKVVFGAGVIIYGVLRIFLHDMLREVTAYIVPARHRPLGDPMGPAYALIIAGVAFSIWGLIKKNKKNTPAA